MNMMHDLGRVEPPPEPPFDLGTLGLDPARILPDGVYFDLDEDRYHGAFGLSYSGMKSFRVSPYLWWATSPLNPGQDKVLAEEKFSEAKTLGQAFDARIICGAAYYTARYAPAFNPADHPDALEGADAIKDALRKLKSEGADVKLSGKKADMIANLLEIQPSAKIMDVLRERYEAKHEGKTFLDPDWMEKIEVAAALIEKHPELSKALIGGAPQVSVIWTCEKTGIPLRARFDYLKQKLILDLKTFEARGDLPLEMAIGKEIGFRKYYLQAAMYAEAAAQIPRLIAAGQVHGTAPAGFLDLLARHPKKAYAWIFQVKGPAPQAFGYTLPEQSMLWAIGNAEIDNAKHLFRDCLDRFGALPWLDATGFRALDDANVPAWALQ